MTKWIPTAPEVVREAVIVIAGALLAAFVIGRIPGARAWIQTNLGTSPIPPQQ